MITKLKNKNGFAIILALLFTVVLIGISAVFILRVFNEANLARLERESTKDFFAAQAGAQAALEQMDIFINTYLLNTISAASPSGVISNATSKVAAGDGIGWLVYAVRNNNVPVFTQNGEEVDYTQTASVGGTNYTYNIVITEKSDPVAVSTDVWDFLYNYYVTSTSSSSGVTRKVATNGDFTVRVQRDNFAKFALYTNAQTTPSGTNIWFTNKTNFAGPVHTNDRFNFALNPSGTFEEALTQVQQTARFYNSGSPVLLNADKNGMTDVPTFNSTFTRNTAAVTLNTSTNEQSMISQAQGNGGGSFTSNGIYVPASGSNLNGGIYVKGDSTVNLSVDGSDNAVYTITQGSTTKKVTINRSAQQTTVLNVNTGVSSTYNGMPDGTDNVGTLIYVSGNITSLAGTVQKNAEVTIASKNDVIITNNVKYADYTAAVGSPGQAGYVPPTAAGTTNLLGIVSWNGNVRIGTSAPNNVEVHGSVLAQSGIFQVDNYTDTNVGTRGTATLLGGAITNYYGGFGQFNGSTGQAISGYGRNFVYDQRMQQGSAPPYFPSLNTFIAFTNDITDKLVWQGGE